MLNVVNRLLPSAPAWTTGCRSPVSPGKQLPHLGHRRMMAYL